MRVIITGGSGLIGQALMDSLLGDGHEVIILSRNPERVTGLRPGARAERWDGRTAESWGHLADGAGAIVNLAGESIGGNNIVTILFQRWTSDYKRRILESRLNAGQAVVEAVRAAKQKPGVVVQASAVGYYGERGDDILTEGTPPGDDFQAQVCQAWEASTAEVEQLGVRRAIARTAVVLSRRGGVLPMIVLPFRFFTGGPLGSGKQWFSWIHMEDQVAALRFLIDSGASGPFNVCAPRAATNADFGRAVGQVIKRPFWLPVPAFALQLMMGEKSTIVLGSQRQVPQRLQELGYKFKFPDATLALRNLLK